MYITGVIKMDLKKLRKKMRVTQSQVAKAIGIPQTTYSSYEQHICDPSIDTLIKLADFFCISLDELVGRPTSVLNLNLLDEKRKTLVLEMANASDSAINRLEAFYQGVKVAELEREELIRKIKEQRNG